MIGAVRYDKAGVQSLDSPGRREAAGGHGAGFQGKVLERQKHDLVTAITEQMTGLSNYACEEIWGDQP
jgi:hypothetical protein